MPVHRQFASGRVISGSPIVSVADGGYFTNTVKLWIGLQKRNRVGYNRVSELIGITAGTGQKITITIPESERATGEDWHEFVIVAATSNNPTRVKRLAAIAGYDSSGVKQLLPVTITLDRDDHVTLAPIVASLANLPTSSDRMNGMVRGVTSLNSFYTYSAASNVIADGTKVLSTDTGRWLRISTPNTYVIDTKVEGGSDIPIQLATQEVAASYALDNSPGAAFSFWLVNDNPASSGIIVPQGTRINLKFWVDGKDKSQGLSRKMQIVFLGHVDMNTGILDSSMGGAGGSVPYTYGKSSLLLQQDLQPGQAWAFQVYPQLSVFEVDDFIPNGALVTVYPDFYGQSGAYTEVGLITGDIIAKDGQQRRIVPGPGLSLYALAGGGIVKSHGFHRGTTLVSGLLANTDNQFAVIDTNGTVYALQNSAAIPASASIRAVVGTKLGASNPGAYSQEVILSNSGRLDIICYYPVDVNGNGVIRSDYPDVIASNRSSYFNPPLLTIYVKQASSGEVRKFENLAVISGVTSQNFSIANWNSGVLIEGGVLPLASQDFSLFAPGNTTLSPVTGGSGGVPPDSYQATYSFLYNGSQVTLISHAQELGTIEEASATLGDLFAIRRSWGEAVVEEEIRAIPQNETYSYQTRRVAGTNKKIYFDPNSKIVDNGINSWLPNYLNEFASGRWLEDKLSFNTSQHLPYLKLQLLGEPPPTGEGEVALWVDVTEPKKLKMRSPNNGEVSVIGSGSTASPVGTVATWDTADWNSIQWNEI